MQAGEHSHLVPSQHPRLVLEGLFRACLGLTLSDTCVVRITLGREQAIGPTWDYYATYTPSLRRVKADMQSNRRLYTRDDIEGTYCVHACHS